MKTYSIFAEQWDYDVLTNDLYQENNAKGIYLPLEDPEIVSVCGAFPDFAYNGHSPEEMEKLAMRRLQVVKERFPHVVFNLCESQNNIWGTTKVIATL